MAISPLAGKPAPKELLVDPATLERTYYERRPDVAARADRFIARVRDLGGDVLAFSSGHIIRMIAARWLGLPPSAGRLFFCRPASVGVLGFEHDSREQPTLCLWNYISAPRE